MKGLFKSAIRDPDPVAFFIHIGDFGKSGSLPAGEFYEPLGAASIRREGTHVTLVTYNPFMLRLAYTAAMILDPPREPAGLIAKVRELQEAGQEFPADLLDELTTAVYGQSVLGHNITPAAFAGLDFDLPADRRISVEIIDLRTLVPLDFETIATSVRKTGRLIVLHESVKVAGFGAEIIARITENFDTMYALKARPIRIGAANTPVPVAPNLLWSRLPSLQDIIQSARSLMEES
ncbi:hypothetical protein JW905_04195 [bacterium]|nr:hypothetical protein [candidate division CSSED10-310 bacterium]